VLRLSDDEAFGRIRAARTARKHPAIFQAVADRRLHLTAVLALAPHLDEQNAGELLAAALDRSKSELERWLAGRFPRPDLPARIEALAGSSGELVPERVEGPPTELVPERVEAPVPRPKVAPLAADRYGVQFTMRQRVHDKLRHLEALLGHRIHDLDAIFEAGLDARIREFERRKYAATDRPRRNRGPATSRPRYISAEVKRAVRARDGGRCTFVSDTGLRCEARSRLEFDHVEPVARGGMATAGNLRLRCRGHNQYAAEQAFGADFMRNKRDESRRSAGERLAPVPSVAAAEKALPSNADDRNVVPWLLTLGFRIGDARRAASHCESLPQETSLEDRVRAALRFLTPPHRLPRKPDDIAA
jgi:hypothetical protein